MVGFKKRICWNCYVTSWRTLANQEEILWIGPLGKLGRFESTAEIFLVYIASISLASGPILSITSWYAKVLRGHLLKFRGLDDLHCATALEGDDVRARTRHRVVENNLEKKKTKIKTGFSTSTVGFWSVGYRSSIFVRGTHFRRKGYF